MLTYHYSARNVANGQKVKADVQAQSEQDAYKLIRKEGLTPIEIKLAEGGAFSSLNGHVKHIKARDKVLFARQLSTLINAGLPIVQSLRSVALQTQSKPLRIVINNLITDVEAGTAFSAALAK